MADPGDRSWCQIAGLSHRGGPAWWAAAEFDRGGGPPSAHESFKTRGWSRADSTAKRLIQRLTAPGSGDMPRWQIRVITHRGNMQRYLIRANPWSKSSGPDRYAQRTGTALRPAFRGSYLNFLAVVKDVSPATQKSALNALSFFFKHCLGLTETEFGEFGKATSRQHIPVVMSFTGLKCGIRFSSFPNTSRTSASLIPITTRTLALPSPQG